MEGGGGVAAFAEVATLEDLLALLPRKQRLAYVMRWQSGLSDHAIAAHLRVSVEEARRLCGDAQRTLLRRLPPGW